MSSRIALTTAAAIFNQTERVDLTTLFSPKAECVTRGANTTVQDPGLYATVTFGTHTIVTSYSRAAQFYNTPAESCVPTDFVRYQFYNTIYYSPGVCPSSYEYVSASVRRDAQGDPVTCALCCPSAFTSILTDGSPKCYSIRSINNEQAVLATNFPVSVAWRADDLPLFTPTSAPALALRSAGFDVAGRSSTSASATSTTPTAVSPGQPSSLSSAKTESGLSTGASVGIGIGVAAGVVLVLALLWWFIRRQRASKEGTSAGELDSRGETSAALGHKHEKDSRAIHEAENTSKPVEMEGGGRWELDGGWQGVEIGHGGRSAT